MHVCECAHRCVCVCVFGAIGFIGVCLWHESVCLMYIKGEPLREYNFVINCF